MTLADFLIGLPVMMLCLFFQVAVAYWSVRFYVQHLVDSPQPVLPGFIAGAWPIFVAMVAMVFGNFAQISLWACLFVLLGEFASFQDAIYHSAVNFTSLGYGDIIMSKQRRLLGPLEALNGVLMLGMTAAALMVIMQHMIRSQRDALLASRND